MQLMCFSNFLFNTLQICLMYFFTINSVCCQRFSPAGFYPGYYSNQEEHYAKIEAALGKLEHAPQWAPNWPDPTVNLGQVSAVALDNKGQVLVFHRGSHVWDASTFNLKNVYQFIGDPPIEESTIYAFNDTGLVVDKWGENLFHMPHGITVDREGNVWLTDVAMHQVFKFSPQNRKRPALTLGEKFVPGSDNTHFCKPSAVAVLKSGDFFVADGYCNTRIIKFASDGTRILQWGRSKGDSPFVFNVPHALTLAEDRGLVCTADRENGRVACFRADNGTYVAAYRSWLIGGRLFSVAYAPVHGGRLYVVNGPGTDVPVRGYVIDFTSGRLIQTFAPKGSFHNPHDVIVTPDGANVYVAEINPYRVYRFTDEAMLNESLVNKSVQPLPVKPTATADVSPTQSAPDPLPWPRAGWRTVAGGALGALVTALLVAATLALLRARNRGRKGATRRRWEYGHGEFKLRRLLERRRFTRVHSEDSDDEPAPMLPPQPPANA